MTPNRSNQQCPATSSTRTQTKPTDQLKARLSPIRGRETGRAASVVVRGHAFIQNLRRGHYELGTDSREHLRTVAALEELTETI
jgi:IS6 family transposase